MERCLLVKVGPVWLLEYTAPGKERCLKGSYLVDLLFLRFLDSEFL